MSSTEETPVKNIAWYVTFIKGVILQYFAQLKIDVINWYGQETWLHSIPPFSWYEAARNAQAAVVVSAETLEKALHELELAKSVHLLDSRGLEQRIEKQEECLRFLLAECKWISENGALNNSAKTTALRIIGLITGDPQTLSRDAVTAAARKR